MKLSNRVLFTGDCTYLFQDQIYGSAGEPYSAKIFHDHVNHLAACGVDTVLVNPNGQRAWYPSKVFPTVFDDYKRGDREFFRNHAVHCDGVGPKELDKHLDKQVKFFQCYLDLADRGIDWVAEMASDCARNRVAPWLSIRMNDLHGTGDQQGSYMNCPLYRNKSMRLSGTSLNPRDGVTQYWQGLNYEKREVRDYMMSLIRELVNDYAYEGIELDWLRNPECCEPPASQEAIETVVQWIAEIRELTDAKSKQIGKPYPLGLRVSGNLGLVRSLGLDVVRLAREGTVDFVSPSNFWQTSWDMPHDAFRQLLGPDVTIFGVVEDAPNWLKGAATPQEESVTAGGKVSPRMLSASPELLRANAVGKLALGAQGIEVFNFFCTDSDVWQAEAEKENSAKYELLKGISDLEYLRGKPKHYAFSNAGAGTWYPPFEIPEQFPVSIEPQCRRSFRLAMCAETTDVKLTGIMQVILDNTGPETPDIGVSLNGAWPSYKSTKTTQFVHPTGSLSNLPPGHRAFNFPFDPRQVREGWNEIVVFNNADFYSLITAGKISSEEDRRRNSIRLINLEIGMFAEPRPE